MAEKKYPDPKIPEPGIVAGLIGFIILDLGSVVPILNWITTGIATIVEFFISFSGIGGIVLVFTYAVGFIVEVIPGASAFPTLTLVWIITIIFDRYPQILPKWIRDKIELAGQVAQMAKSKGAKGAAGALEGAEGAVAKEASAAATAERGAAGAAGQGVQEEGSLAAGNEAGGSAKTGEGSAEGASKSNRERLKESFGGSEGGGEAGMGEMGSAEGGGGNQDGGEGRDENLSLEEQREQNAIRGMNIEDLKLDLFPAEQMMADAESPVLGAKVLKFDPNRAIEPKPAREWAKRDNTRAKGIINSEKIDLSNNNSKQKAA